MGLQHFVACEESAWEDGGSLGCEKVLRGVVQSICSPLPGSNRRPFGYRPNALPLSQGGDGQILERLRRSTASEEYAWEGGGSLGCEKGVARRGAIHLQPPAGLEPVTFWLQAKCSAIEPRRRWTNPSEVV